MYSVEKFLEQTDKANDDDLEHIIEGTDEKEQDGSDAEVADESSSKKVAKKVRKPSNRPKLDAERLKGPRGLSTMEKLFTKIQFQGEGYEQQDLQAVMKTMEYWCHRLFPKYSFDDCLEHLERLGTKKPVITLKKKILFDLFEEDRPFETEENDLNVDTQEDINEFDMLLQQGPIDTFSQRSKTPERVELTEDQKEIIQRNRLVATERRNARLAALQQKQNERNAQDSSMDSQLSEEQKATIERNRQLAIDKRKVKNNLDTSVVHSSQDAGSTVDFNELVESFFPSTEDNLQEAVEDVDINDLIDEINPAEVEEIEASNNLNSSKQVTESESIETESIYENKKLNSSKDTTLNLQDFE